MADTEKMLPLSSISGLPMSQHIVRYYGIFENSESDVLSLTYGFVATADFHTVLYK
jgi:hypothetical protein